MENAVPLFQSGQTVQAEELLLRAARDAESTHGPNHPATATAYNELGTILLNVQNLPAAIQAFRRAWGIHVPIKVSGTVLISRFPVEPRMAIAL